MDGRIAGRAFSGTDRITTFSRQCGTRPSWRATTSSGSLQRHLRITGKKCLTAIRCACARQRFRRLVSAEEGRFPVELNSLSKTALRAVMRNVTLNSRRAFWILLQHHVENIDQPAYRGDADCAMHILSFGRRIHISLSLFQACRSLPILRCASMPLRHTMRTGCDRT